jgi:molybdate/tungstate transport system substrate-binding protein
MQGRAYRFAMKMQRRGVSSAATNIAVTCIAVAIVVAGIGAVVVLTSPKSTSTSTSMAVTSAMTSSTSTGSEGPLISYSADAYAPEVTSLLNGFSSSTGVQVAPVKSGGSTADASAIEAGAPDDVFVSSSLAATSSAYLGNLTAGWTIGFATDQMVVAYSNSTTQTFAASSVISLGDAAGKSNATSDWNSFYAALVSGTVKVGISDPSQDPGGLRGWLALEIAGDLYSGGNSSAYTSILLSDHDNVTAASAADLVAPLQAGEIQFLFTYKSAAVSSDLPYITLDSHVNLSSTGLAPLYAKFSYTDSAGTTKGSPIVISVTMPMSAVNTAGALQFVQYVVQNSNSLSTFGVVPLSPCVIYESTAPPAAIQQLVTQGLVVSGGSLP